LGGGPCRNTAITFGLEKTRMAWLPEGENSLKICLFVSTEYMNATDRQTDKLTDEHRTTA